jgi:putative Ca2+/H+ antiporter (TMEM165/GDT1 family)
MNETKSALLKLLMAYVFCVASVFVIAVLATLLTGGLSGRRGLPLGAAIALAILAAFVLLGIFVCIAIGVAVFIDAKQRDMEPWLWAMVAASPASHPDRNARRAGALHPGTLLTVPTAVTSCSTSARAAVGPPTRLPASAPTAAPRSAPLPTAEDRLQRPPRMTSIAA